MDIPDLFLQWLISLVILSQAQQTYLLTNFPGYSQLAPCATPAVIDRINGLSGDCQNIATPTVQASCACLKNQNSASIASELSSAVIYYCGSTATDDVTSAIAVFSSYCAEAKPIITKEPLPPSVVPLTNFPGYSLLAPCATPAFIDRINGLSGDCQNIATPTVQASCACLKNQNSISITNGLSSAVSYYCGSTATDDITSAVDVFSSYCIMAHPITIKAPLPTSIVALTNFPGYSVLAPCATHAYIDRINDLSGDCQNIITPTVEASCACLKNQNSMSIINGLSVAVSYYCGSTATDDVTSAVDVFSSYCIMAQPITTKAPLPTSIVALTNFPAYSLLIPCVTHAFNDRLNDLSGDCQNIITPTVEASCACLKNQNSMSITNGLSVAVSYYCGSTATDDITSAVDVFSSYCAMAKPITTQAPLPTSVVPLTNFPAYSLLAPCATHAFMDRLNDLSGDCQNIAIPTIQASCACIKNQNYASITNGLSYAVSVYCGSTATDDVTSAVAVFSSYCALFTGAPKSSTSLLTSTRQSVPSIPSTTPPSKSSTHSVTSMQSTTPRSKSSYMTSTPASISSLTSITSTSPSVSITSASALPPASSGISGNGNQNSSLSATDQIIMGVLIPLFGIFVAIVLAVYQKRRNV